MIPFTEAFCLYKKCSTFSGMKFFKSFTYAWQGIQYCFKTQMNFKVHLVLLFLVMIAGILLKISNIEWLFIIGCSALVLSLELINTAIEFLCDIVTKEIHPSIKIIKDLGAAAVLLTAAGSVIIGLVIFLPKIIALFR